MDSSNLKMADRTCSCTKGVQKAGYTDLVEGAGVNYELVPSRSAKPLFAPSATGPPAGFPFKESRAKIEAVAGEQQRYQQPGAAE